jgi:hypothetical protein
MVNSTYPSPAALSTPAVGASSVQVATPNLQRAGLYVFNPSGTVTIWVSPTGTAASATGAGSIAVQPQQGVMFGAPTMPSWTNGMNAIASAAGSNVIAILEFYP